MCERVLTYEEEAAAEVRLQNAAPALLAALKGLVDEVRLGAATSSASMDARLEAAVAAIKMGHNRESDPLRLCKPCLVCRRVGKRPR